MAGQMPTPLFQEWFGLNRNINSHFADKIVFIVFLGGGDSNFKDVVTRRGNSFFGVFRHFFIANLLVYMICCE